MLGFLLQGLQYVGWTVKTSDAANAAAAGTTLVVAGVVGWIAYGLVWVLVFRREWAWATANTGPS